MKIRLLSPVLSLLLASALLAACSPKYNWRDYASPDAPYKVTFPAKPASFTRSIDLDGLQVSMTMTAAEVDGATFAVGSAEAPDEARARAALPAMMQALLRNIGAGGTQGKFQTDPNGKATGDVDATGSSNGVPVRLVGHFEARGKRFYQVIVLGKANAVPPEQVEQFLTSFSL
ncbi:hypothetical protein SRABI118_00522 [Massilia sp. Bi118]|uniref:hypothetical protein n=1 Tax=Massilia sp. Bi118 TaxID=2822346 RepID=UPI001D543570|nr:hypothetical protein [Massilia sp. Bi118]CAH0151325.1 hypothetical protein SRABI118_00522 [Massilia sp. Bi118]